SRLGRDETFRRECARTDRRAYGALCRQVCKRLVVTFRVGADREALRVVSMREALGAAAAAAAAAAAPGSGEQEASRLEALRRDAFLPHDESECERFDGSLAETLDAERVVVQGLDVDALENETSVHVALLCNAPAAMRRLVAAAADVPEEALAHVGSVAALCARVGTLDAQMAILCAAPPATPATPATPPAAPATPAPPPAAPATPLSAVRLRGALRPRYNAESDFVRSCTNLTEARLLAACIAPGDVWRGRLVVPERLALGAFIAVNAERLGLALRVHDAAAAAAAAAAASGSVAAESAAGTPR